jgi:hypothetical protein
MYPGYVGEITFSADDGIIERAREVARSKGKTLQAAFYDWLISYASSNTTSNELEDLFRRLKYAFRWAKVHP